MMTAGVIVKALCYHPVTIKVWPDIPGDPVGYPGQ